MFCKDGLLAAFTRKWLLLVYVICRDLKASVCWLTFQHFAYVKQNSYAFSSYLSQTNNIEVGGKLGKNLFDMVKQVSVGVVLLHEQSIRANQLTH